VGSGPAGCVVANRLTENPNWNVLLIEAGTVETLIEQIPLFAPYEFLTRYNWGYLAERQPYSCLGRLIAKMFTILQLVCKISINFFFSPTTITTDRPERSALWLSARYLLISQCCHHQSHITFFFSLINFQSGKALGGTSVINGMLYTRGFKEDFDEWVNLGNYNWDYYETVLPAYKKSEKARLKFFHKHEFHNSSGLLSVSHNQYQTPIAQIFLDANKQIGLDEIDYNADENIGVAHLQANTQRGRRHSAYKSFIEPFLHRRNLHIMLNTRVTKVLIDQVTRVAYGVELLRKKKRQKIIARREVVLSAGTFHSAQLLMLSGIGPREDLERIGVPLVHDSPVGKEMYDHISFPGLLFTTNLTNPNAPLLHIKNMLKIMGGFFQGKGYGTVPNGVESLAFIQTPTFNAPNSRLPNMELILLTIVPQTDNGHAVRESERMSEWLYDSVYRPLEGETTYSFLIVLSLLHPKSVGYMTLRDRNIFSAPKFYSNFFKEPEDVESILEAIKYTLFLTNAEPFRSVDAKLHDIPIPTCAHLGFGSDDYWRCAIR
jgi:choline dehydrogenase